jgi:hypothetical protein
VLCFTPISIFMSTVCVTLADCVWKKCTMLLCRAFGRTASNLTAVWKLP